MVNSSFLLLHILTLGAINRLYYKLLEFELKYLDGVIINGNMLLGSATMRWLDLC